MTSGPLSLSFTTFITTRCAAGPCGRNVIRRSTRKTNEQHSTTLSSAGDFSILLPYVQLAPRQCRRQLRQKGPKREDLKAPVITGIYNVWSPRAGKKERSMVSSCAERNNAPDRILVIEEHL